MFSKFLSLDEEKQNRILNASMKEFAHKGYDNASTNKIVKDAGISKGLLFHYFNNKKQLFLFLYNYCVDQMVNELYKKMDLNERDIILRLQQTMMHKMELLKKYPEIIDFLKAAYMETSPEVREEIATKTYELTENDYGRAFENIDTSKFKDGIDVGKAINIIIWTFEGFSDSEIKKAKMSPSHKMDYDRIFAEGDAYMKIFRKCFYKDEYGG